MGARPRRGLQHRDRERGQSWASAAVQVRGSVAVGLTNTTHFLRPLTSGIVTVEAVALSQGRTHQLWRVDITDSAGRLIAHGEVRLQNVQGATSEPRQHHSGG